MADTIEDVEGPAGTTARGHLPPVLEGLQVLDLSHQYSGALAASFMADLGASVVAVEHPSRKAIRTMLPRKGDDSLWWKVCGRGKRSITLDLSKPQGRDMFLAMATRFDVIVENFRPGTLERWGLGPEEMSAHGVDAVVLRISGFGQTGPARFRPGFGTVAEAMSGFANLNGEPDGAPTFPSTTLGDGVAAVFGGMGILAALWGRARHPDRRGVEIVDVALFEGLFRSIPTQVAEYDQLGSVPKRPGNKLTSHGVLRNLYRTEDDRYVCVSAVGPYPAGRILAAAGATDLLEELEAGAMATEPTEVVEFLDRCDAHLAAWAAERSFEVVCAAFDEHDAVYQSIYDIADITKDPQYQAREDLISVPDPNWGEILMQGVVPKFPGRAHEVSSSGPDRGAHNAEVFAEYLGLTSEDLKKLADENVV